MSKCRPVKVTSSMFTHHAKCSTIKQDKGEATRGFEPWENHIIMDERVLRALRNFCHGTAFVLIGTKEMCDSVLYTCFKGNERVTHLRLGKRTLQSLNLYQCEKS